MITSVSQEHKVMRHCWKTSNAALCALKNVNALWYSLSFFCRRGFGKEAKMPQQFAQNSLFECYNLPSRGNHVPGSKSFGKVRPSWDKMRRRWRCANAFGFTEKKCQGLLKWSPFTSSTPGIRNVVPFSSFLLWLLRPACTCKAVAWWGKEDFYHGGSVPFKLSFYLIARSTHSNSSSPGIADGWWTAPFVHATIALLKTRHFLPLLIQCIKATSPRKLLHVLLY